MRVKRFIEFINEEKIPGGLAKGMSVDDLAKMHGVSVDLIKSELEKGKTIETEHTFSREAAEEIAMDHIYEDPRYYSKLEKIE